MEQRKDKKTRNNTLSTTQKIKEESVTAILLKFAYKEA